MSEQNEIKGGRLAELAELFADDKEAAALLLVDVHDPATWPESMRLAHADMAARQGAWEGNEHQDWPEIRRALVREAIDRGTVAETALEYVLFAALQARVPKGSLDYRLLLKLEDAALFETCAAVDVCLEIVPVIWRLLPYESVDDVLAAASAMATESDGGETKNSATMAQDAMKGGMKG